MHALPSDGLKCRGVEYEFVICMQDGPSEQTYVVHEPMELALCV